jgi:hypothetical protein
VDILEIESEALGYEFDDSATSSEQSKSVDHRRSSGAACIYSRNPPAFM